VTWSVRGERSGVAAVLARLVPVDRFLARDLERGLDRLAELARP
jgi:HAMP domain-containing protein